MKTAPKQPRKPNRIKRPTSISLGPVLLDRARRLMAEDGYVHLTAMVEELIRREWARRHAPAMLHAITDQGQVAASMSHSGVAAAHEGAITTLKDAPRGSK